MTNITTARDEANGGLQLMKRLTVLVPAHDNQGVDFAPSAVAAFELFAARLAGGLTYFGLARGLWWSDGMLYRDVNHWYVANVTPQHATSVAMELNDYIVAMFDQKAAYVEVTDAMLTDQDIGTQTNTRASVPALVAAQDQSGDCSRIH
jgi:hypothetical protein